MRLSENWKTEEQVSPLQREEKFWPAWDGKAADQWLLSSAFRCGRTLISCKKGAGKSRLKDRNKGKEVWEGWGSRNWRARAGAACGVCRRECESKNVQSAWAWTPCWGCIHEEPMRTGEGVLERIARSICVLEKGSDSSRKDGLKWWQRD